MKRVLCLLADGVEETELVAPVDVLRRAGAEVVLASMTGQREITGKHDMVLVADSLIEDVDPAGFDLLFLPGGPAVMWLREDGRAAKLAAGYAAAGKPVAAICAAPLLLKDAGLLEGRRHTAHFSVYGELDQAEADERVLVDAGVTTSRGAGTAVDFGLVLAAQLTGDKSAREVAESIMA